MYPQYEANTQASMMQDYPTSPWTEAYQDSFATSEQPPQDDDAQQPTHDALSEIYNRGYSA